MENNVLPLINVVFLLLIFFMITGTVIQEPPFTVDAPDSSHTDSQELQQRYLAVSADGKLAWAGKTVAAEKLRLTLEQRQNPEAVLQVRADQKLEANELSRLLADLRKAGIAQIQLLTQHQP